MATIYSKIWHAVTRSGNPPVDAGYKCHLIFYRPIWFVKKSSEVEWCEYSSR